MDKDHKYTLPGLPPLPKSLSVAAGNSALPLAHVSSSTHSNNASPLNHAQHALAHDDNAADLYLGASTSNAAVRHQHHRHSQRHGSLSSTQESLSDRESVHSRASSSHSSHHTPTNNSLTTDNTTAGISSASSSSTSTLDQQLAILRREMYGLRQLDLNLLSQLWALNESIQGFRVFLQEQDTISPPSQSPTPSDTNSLTSEPDEDESFSAQQPKLIQQPMLTSTTTLPCGSITSHASTSSNSGTSGSSGISGNSSHHQQLQQIQYQSKNKVMHGPQPPPPLEKTHHPQLPRILQQRMRRAPPPPPPNRPKQSTSAHAEQRPV